MASSAKDIRKYGTCFFEQYAQISLSELLGGGYETLVNRDRPDLQTPDGSSIGIEVTRAMEENKASAQAMLKDVAGLTRPPRVAEIDSILEYGYSYGLTRGRIVGSRELPYWEMALPLRRILVSKVAKVWNGFYGRFDRMGLFVFCKDDLHEADAVKAMNYTIGLQKLLEIRYNLLFLADIDDLFVCNLDEGLKTDSRLSRFHITQDQRKSFYLEAVRRQLG